MKIIGWRELCNLWSLRHYAMAHGVHSIIYGVEIIEWVQMGYSFKPMKNRGKIWGYWHKEKHDVTYYNDVD